MCVIGEVGESIGAAGDKWCPKCEMSIGSDKRCPDCNTEGVPEKPYAGKGSDKFAETWETRMTSGSLL
jgi:hypothetical protein